MYFDLYPLEMIKNKTKLKQNKKKHWPVNSFLYRQSPWQKRQPNLDTHIVWILIKTSVSVFHLTISLDIKHNGMTLVNH